MHLGLRRSLHWQQIRRARPGHIELVPPDSLPRATGGESKTASARVEDRRKNKTISRGVAAGLHRRPLPWCGGELAPPSRGVAAGLHRPTHTSIVI
jgi:hypothetical protein